MTYTNAENYQILPLESNHWYAVNGDYVINSEPSQYIYVENIYIKRTVEYVKYLSIELAAQYPIFEKNEVKKFDYDNFWDGITEKQMRLIIWDLMTKNGAIVNI